MAALSAAAASIVSLTTADESDIDFIAVSAAVSTMTSNLAEMAKNVKLLTKLDSDKASSKLRVGELKHKKKIKK